MLMRSRQAPGCGARPSFGEAGGARARARFCGTHAPAGETRVLVYIACTRHPECAIDCQLALALAALPHAHGLKPATAEAFSSRAGSWLYRKIAMTADPG